MHVKKNCFSIFFLMVSVCCSNLFAQNTVPEIRVMTYNIRYANNNPGEAWSERKDKVISIIQLAKPDILGVQEALKIQLDDLINLLKNYEVIGIGRDDGKDGGEFSAILFDKEKLSVVKHNTFWLSETPDVPSKGWDAAYPRICTWAEFKLKENGQTFYCFNTHFDHIGINARNNSAELILEKISEKKNGIILMGDFNSNDTSYVYKKLTGSAQGENNSFSLIDSKLISENGSYGDNITFNGFGNSIVEGNGIDYIFVSKGFTVKNHYTLGEKIDNHYPSDHMPVLIDLILE